MINNFGNEYSFLSNSFLCPVSFEGLDYTNAESLFQSCKFRKVKSRKVFTNMGPNSAILKGRHVTLRDDWEDVKEKYMYRVVKAKFQQNPDLKQKLLDTKEEELINGNMKHDNFWGKCYCEKCTNRFGRNKLGEILMKVRKEFQDAEVKNRHEVPETQN